MSLDTLDQLSTGQDNGRESNPIPYPVIKWSVKDETTLTYIPQVGKEFVGTMIYKTETPRYKDDVPVMITRYDGTQVPAMDTCLHFLGDDGQVYRMYATGQLWTAFAEANVKAGFGTMSRNNKPLPKWPVRRYKVKFEKVVALDVGKANQFAVTGPIAPKDDQIEAIKAANKEVSAYYASREADRLNGGQQAPSRGPFDGPAEEDF
jgi:hypothetical protein